MYLSSKRQAIIFGAGQIGQRLCLHAQAVGNDEILFFVDNNSELWNTSFMLNGKEYDVFSPEQIPKTKYDKVHIAVKDAEREIYVQLVMNLQVPEEKIDCSYLTNFVANVGQRYLESRIWFLACHAQNCKSMGIAGAVAEVGVYRGAFAKEINRCFSDRRLYLYDTFEGFDERDISQELLLSQDADSLKKWRNLMGNFSNTSDHYVKSRLPNPEKCVIKKGYFPETFTEESETFAFVNLDCDLYSPIKAGLELFYPRMSRGGVILVHEYFDEISFLPGIKQAVREFVEQNNCVSMPIGDMQSLAIVKV